MNRFLFIFIFHCNILYCQNKANLQGLQCHNFSQLVFTDDKVEVWAKDFTKISDKKRSKLLFTFDGEKVNDEEKEHFFKADGRLATEQEYLAGKAQKWVPQKKSSVIIINRKEANAIVAKVTAWKGGREISSCSVITLLKSESAPDTYFDENIYGYKIENQNLIFSYDASSTIDSIQTVFIAGSFNDWAENDVMWEMKKMENKYQLSIPIKTLNGYIYCGFSFVVNGNTWISPPVKASNTLSESDFKYSFVLLK
jgi:hypothetical protein